MMSFCKYFLLLFTSSGEKDHYNVDLEDEVVRGSIILHNVSALKCSQIYRQTNFFISEKTVSGWLSR